MKLVKKLAVLVVALFAVFALAACDKDSKDTLTVGTPNLSGDFIAGFGSSAYDVYVRDLVHGYGTLVETKAGEFVWDTKAVLASAPTTSEDDEGNKTYTFKLQEDLKFNTGAEITAKEYVAAMLLLSSNDWTSIATNANAGYYLVGFEEYRYGKAEDPADQEEVDVKDEEGNVTGTKWVTKKSYSVEDRVFPGVRLLGKYEFALTIDEDNLPYFYEVTMVSSSPIPLHAYLPGYDVKDDGEGSYITKVDATKDIKDTVADTINKAEEGLRFKPVVTAGPYQFVSFKDQIVRVELNPEFKTNYEGKKPSIQNVIIKSINTETDVQQVISGAVDLVNGVVEGAKIEDAKNNPKKVSLVSYARNGYGLIAFAQYFGPVKEVEVRRAMAYLLDRRVFLDQILGGYGTLVNGPYGEAQWFYQETKAELQEKLINYTLDIDKANQELDESSYKFEADGVTPFDPAKAKADGSYLRHNADKDPLFINHFSASKEIGDAILLQYQENGWKAGLKFELTQGDFDTLLDHYYYGSSKSEEDLQYHSFNLATNFYSDYDPFWSWHSSLAGTTNNPGMTKDDEIDRVTELMQKLDPAAKAEFKELFVEFVVRWNEILPNIPIYSNEYFDVYNNRISGVDTSPVWSWAKGICDIKIG